MKTALVYDRINKWGGAERVLLALHEMFPEAPLYTSVYDPAGSSWANVFPKIITSFLQKFPFAKRNHELYPYLMPLAFESFNFDQYDLVISVTSEAAKGIITGPKTKHICYCLTPTRYLWQSYQDYFQNPLTRILSKPLVFYLQNWDKIAAQRPNMMIAISETVKQRIQRYYNRESTVIYPPVDLKWEVGNEKLDNELRSGKNGISLQKISPQDPASHVSLLTSYFLVVSRLVSYKKVHLVIEAFNQLGWDLKIIGKGKEEENLKRLAKNNIEFLHDLTDQELLSYYKNCAAFIVPQEEDFGLAIVEAQSFGKPVIAFKKGGALEIIKEGVTGQFFYPQTASGLTKSLKNFSVSKFKSEDCLNNAERFSKERFKEQFRRLIK